MSPYGRSTTTFNKFRAFSNTDGTSSSPTKSINTAGTTTSTITGSGGNNSTSPQNSVGSTSLLGLRYSLNETSNATLTTSSSMFTTTTTTTSPSTTIETPSPDSVLGARHGRRAMDHALSSTSESSISIASSQQDDDISSFALYDDISSFALSLGSSDPMSSQNKANVSMQTTSSMATPTIDNLASGSKEKKIQDEGSTSSSKFGFEVGARRTAFAVSSKASSRDQLVPSQSQQPVTQAQPSSSSTIDTASPDRSSASVIVSNHKTSASNLSGRVSPSPSLSSFSSFGTNTQSQSQNQNPNPNYPRSSSSKSSSSSSRHRRQGSAESGRVSLSSLGTGGGSANHKNANNNNSNSKRRTSKTMATVEDINMYQPNFDRQGSGSNGNSHHSRSGSTDSGRQLHEKAAKHLQRGELEEALNLFKDILRYQKEQYGSQHRCVGAALHNVAVVHIKANRHADALPVMKDAVEVRRKSLGEFHRDVVSSMVKLGTIQMTLKDYDSANDSFREALRIRRHLSQGRDSTQVAQILSYMGLLYFEIGELLSAVTAFEEVLAIHRSCQQQLKSQKGEQADDGSGGTIAETLSNIGTIRSKRKQFDRAIVALEEAMMIQTLHFGEEHPTVLNTVDQLAYAYSKYGSHENAVELYKQMLRAQINKYGATHLECARTLSKMSIVHEKQKNYYAALECTGEVLAIQRRHLDYDHKDLLATKKTFARMERHVRIHAGDDS